MLSPHSPSSNTTSLATVTRLFIIFTSSPISVYEKFRNRKLFWQKNNKRMCVCSSLADPVDSFIDCLRAHGPYTSEVTPHRFLLPLLSTLCLLSWYSSSGIVPNLSASSSESSLGSFFLLGSPLRSRNQRVQNSRMSSGLDLTMEVMRAEKTGETSLSKYSRWQSRSWSERQEEEFDNSINSNMFESADLRSHIYLSKHDPACQGSGGEGLRRSGCGATLQQFIFKQAE